MESDVAVAFFDMCTEELNACTHKIMDDTNMIAAKAVETSHITEAAGGFIGLLVLFMVTFMVFK